MKNTESVNNSDINEPVFSECLWNDLVQRISELFQFETELSEQIKNDRVLKLIAAIPFIAGCTNPLRTAVSNMIIYIMGSRTSGIDLFPHNHSDNDSLYIRLECINIYDEGDQRIIDRGMNMLAYAMVCDYLFKMNENNKNGRYNPISKTVWNYRALRKNLKTDIISVKCPELDKILNIEAGPFVYWAA